MAFITFLGHKKRVGVYRLTGPATVGRSLDCEVYVPDVYLSRQHCRFENHDGLWRVVDLQSSNGTWFGAERRRSSFLKPGDTIEVGTIAIVFNEGEPDESSKPAPFGMGFGAAELMDTVCTEGLRPSDYSKKQSARKLEFANRARARLTQEEEQAEAEERRGRNPFEIAWQLEEWAELDVEQQVATAQEVLLRDWRPPIFNPSPELLRLSRETPAARPATPAAAAPAAASSLAAYGTTAHAVASDDYSLQPTAAPAKRAPAARRPAAVPPDGCVFVPVTWWDRTRDTIAEWVAGAGEFAKRNPSIAGAVAIVLLLVLGAGVKLSPAGKSGPHIYIPPEPDKTLAAQR